MDIFTLFQLVNVAVTLALVVLSIYTLVLTIKCLRRGIKALDYYNAEKKAVLGISPDNEKSGHADTEPVIVEHSETVEEVEERE